MSALYWMRKCVYLNVHRYFWEQICDYEIKNMTLKQEKAYFTYQKINNNADLSIKSEKVEFFCAELWLNLSFPADLTFTFPCVSFG